MLITGGLVMNTRMPGTAASFRVSDWATSSALERALVRAA